MKCFRSASGRGLLTLDRGFLSLFSVLTCLAAMSLAGCGNPFSTEQPLQGYVEGRYSYIASPAGGRLERLLVRRGDTAVSGALLYALDAVHEQEALAQAEQRLAAAAATLADMRVGQRPDELAVIRARLAQAGTALDRSSRQRRRDETQYKNGAISQAELETSRAAQSTDAEKVRELTAQLAVAELPDREQRLAAQEAVVAEAEAARRDALYRLSQQRPTVPRAFAPSFTSPAGESLAVPLVEASAALVVDTLYQVGEWVPAGAPVVKLLPAGEVRVRFFVPEAELARLSVGTAVQTRVDGAAKTISCVVDFIAPNAEYTPPIIFSNETRHKLVYMVEARPARAASPADVAVLHPGQPVQVVLP